MAPSTNKIINRPTFYFQEQIAKYEASVSTNPFFLTKKPPMLSMDANVTGNRIQIFNPTSAQWNSEVDLFAFLLAYPEECEELVRRARRLNVTQTIHATHECLDYDIALDHTFTPFLLLHRFSNAYRFHHRHFPKSFISP